MPLRDLWRNPSRILAFTGPSKQHEFSTSTRSPKKSTYNFSFYEACKEN